jgi:antitoxin Phd
VTRPRKKVPTGRWKLEDAKARFSEVVRRAASDGPQMVTVRGAEAAVVVSAGDFERLSGGGREKIPLVAFLHGLDLGGLDLTRDPDFGRDVEL